MEVRTSNEARTNIENFSIRYLNLLLEKKKVDFDIKELKQEFNEEGVPTGKVASIINRIKADKKKSDSELFELEAMREWIEANTEIDDAIGQLGAKS
jgi:uncharacterized protein (UPF0335 family)